MKSRYTVLILLLAAAVVAMGCSAKKRVQTVDYEQQLQEKAQEVTKLQQSMQDLETQMSKQRAELAAQERAAEEARRAAREAEERARKVATADTSTKAPAPSSMVGVGLLPPNAKPGECYARAFVPPTYSTDTERVLKREASERIEVVPAKHESVEERVLVREASTRLEEVPAEYDWVEEKIQVEPAKNVWKKGRGPIEKVDNATGEIMCLVEEPAKYETVRKRVQKKPATVRKIDIPAEYKTIRVNKMVTPPQERRIEIPAEYQTVRKTSLASEGGMEWRPVLCETNMSRDVIVRVQRALQAAGHSPGPIDGVYGQQTRAAVRSYQQSKGLATGGLTLNTLKKLGIQL